jgi:hypothetical protein
MGNCTKPNKIKKKQETLMDSIINNDLPLHFQVYVSGLEVTGLALPEISGKNLTVNLILPDSQYKFSDAECIDKAYQ